jgi:hypothetical protein
VPTSSGCSERRSDAKKCIGTASAIATAMARRRPRTTSCPVTHRFSASSERSTHSASATSVGAGRMRSSTPPARA